ncbi:MAG TPA: Spy/CpxP family protein refolding chaperone [Caulobacteraceae bacterium]|nr:Spy/CpxP family protein refolding chaperone [Caulobacteraceae bacterium]
MIVPVPSLPRLVPPLPRLVPPLAAAIALTAGVALAQPYGGPTSQAYQSPVSAEPSELAKLHAALQITAAQEGAWRAFAAASQPDPQQQARERAAERMLPNLTAPQRVDLSIAAMQADLDTLRQRGDALKAFYATLTPSQRATFDRETLPSQDEGYGR